MFGAVIVKDPKTEGLDLGAELQLITGAKVPTSSDIAKKLLRTFLRHDHAYTLARLPQAQLGGQLPELPINLGGKVIKLSDLNFSMPNRSCSPRSRASARSGSTPSSKG
jgi:hypothetical protein